MDSGWTQDLLNWVASNPGWTGVLVFLIACVESLVVVGILVPGIVMLFGVGAMIGLGAIDLAPIWLWGSAGALAGDLVSYLAGRRYREHLVDTWPFSRYPAMLKRGSDFIGRHGMKSIVAGRFIGPLRPFIPATAGMLGMKPARFIPVDISASIVWTPAYLLPGMLFGASLELATEYAGRLTLVLVILFIALWLTWWLIWAIYEFLVKHYAQWLRRTVAWSRRHPLMGKITGRVLDPTQPEAFAVAMLGVLLVIALWSLALLLFFSPFAARPQAVDQAVMEQALALRNHLADPVMVSLSQMSRWWVLLPAPAAVMLWLLGAGRTSAAVHWMVAIGGGVLLQLALGWTLRATPLLHGAGLDEFYLPSAALTLMTVVLGFFSVMVAGELREQHRKWSYMASALLLTLLLLARVYLGLDWLSGALVGVLLGFTWTAIVGIPYRLRVSKSFSGVVVSLIFFGTLLITVAWQVTQRLDQDLDRLRPELPKTGLSEQAWWSGGWRSFPPERTQFQSVAARRFTAQVAVPLEAMQLALESAGWEPVPRANWQWTLLALNPSPNVDTLPLLSKDYLGHPEVLKMRFGVGLPQRQLTVRAWDSGVRLQPGGQPLYLVQVSEEFLRRRLAFFSYWRALPANRERIRGFLDAMSGFRQKRVGEGLLLLSGAQPTGSEEESPSTGEGGEPDR
jgi:membrane protein DedA with SNARE-associated domain/membrane-associated phospholipid phosphatase